MTNYPIMQLYIELEGFEPKIWRRLEINSNATLAKLAYSIMIMFEIREYYSYQFIIDEIESYKKRHPEYNRRPDRLLELNKKFKKERYGIVDKKNIYMYSSENNRYGELKDATKIQLNKVLQYEKDEITFYYDPEVNWKFTIIFEKEYRDSKISGVELPHLIEGEGYGIIENCTTLKKLSEFRKNSRSKYWREKSDYKFYTTTDNIKKTFNFDKCDVDDVNMRLKAMLQFIKQSYEKERLYKSLKIMKFTKRRYKVRRRNSSTF